MSKFDKTDTTEGMAGSLGGASAAEGEQVGTGECKLKRTASNANLDVNARPCPSRRNKSNNGQPQPCIESAQAALPDGDVAAAAEQPGDDGPTSPPAGRTRSTAAARTRASHNAAVRGDDPVVAMEVDGASTTTEKNTSPEAAGERSAEHRVGSEDVTDAAALDAVASEEESKGDEDVWVQKEGIDNKELESLQCDCGDPASVVYFPKDDTEEEKPWPQCDKCESNNPSEKSCTTSSASLLDGGDGGDDDDEDDGFIGYRSRPPESEKMYGPSVLVTTTPTADPRSIPQVWNKMIMSEMADLSIQKRFGRESHHAYDGPTKEIKQFNRMRFCLENHSNANVRAFARANFSATPAQAQARELHCANCDGVVDCAAHTTGGVVSGLDYRAPVGHAVGRSGNFGCRRRHERCPCGVTVEDSGSNLSFRAHMNKCAFATNVPAVRRWGKANPNATMITTEGLKKKTNAHNEARRLHKWIREALGLSGAAIAAATTEVKKQAVIAVLKEEEVGLTGYL